MNNPFEEIKNQLDSIHLELNELRSVLTSKHEQNNSKPYLGLDEASEFTGLSKSTIYRLTSQKQIPHIKRGRLLFNRAELTSWIQAGSKTI
ncbi:MAG: helix-turn-helix domain-containing protein [Cyclobacteriaceae bacterium]|nr:helix-turn-helix domain-containing protein [Cyclobacteriaceae bacterium]